MYVSHVQVYQLSQPLNAAKKWFSIQKEEIDIKETLHKT